MCRIHKVGLFVFVFLILNLRKRLVEGGVSVINNRNDNVYGHPDYYRNAFRNSHGYIAHRGSRTRYRQQQLIRNIITQYAKALQRNIHTQSLFPQRTTPMSEAIMNLRQHSYGQWARNVMKNYAHALISNATSMTLFHEPTKKLIWNYPASTATPLENTSGILLGDIVRTVLRPDVTIPKHIPTIVPDGIDNASTTLYRDSAISLDISTAKSLIQNYTGVTSTATHSSEQITTTVKMPIQTSVHSQSQRKETSSPVNQVIKSAFGSDSTSVTGAYKPFVTGSNVSPTTEESLKKTDTTSTPDIVTGIERNVSRPDLYESSIDGTNKTDNNVATTQELVVDMKLNNKTSAISTHVTSVPFDENTTTPSEPPSLVMGMNGTTKMNETTTRRAGVVMNETTTSTGDVMNATTTSTGHVMNATTTRTGDVMNATAKSAGGGSNKPTFQILDTQNRREIGTSADLGTAKDVKKSVFARMIQTIDTKGKHAKDHCSDVCAFITGICQNGATCVSICEGMGFMCSCLPGFTGYFCDKIMK